MSQGSDFVHLHVHTEYSMLDGLSRIPQLVEKVKHNLSTLKKIQE